MAYRQNVTFFHVLDLAFEVGCGVVVTHLLDLVRHRPYRLDRRPRDQCQTTAHTPLIVEPQRLLSAGRAHLVRHGYNRDENPGDNRDDQQLEPPRLRPPLYFRGGSLMREKELLGGSGCPAAADYALRAAASCLEILNRRLEAGLVLHQLLAPLRRLFCARLNVALHLRELCRCANDPARVSAAQHGACAIAGALIGLQCFVTRLYSCCTSQYVPVAAASSAAAAALASFRRALSSFLDPLVDAPIDLRAAWSARTSASSPGTIAAVSGAADRQYERTRRARPDPQRNAP
eukprot:COSAG05_NODE_1536_length_4611_cov_7.236093_3_plen_290_part_00